MSFKRSPFVRRGFFVCEDFTQRRISRKGAEERKDRKGPNRKDRNRDAKGKVYWPPTMNYYSVTHSPSTFTYSATYWSMRRVLYCKM